MTRAGMVLVDTSSWIETLRAGGNPAVRQRIAALVVEGEAAWCNMVRLELWNGVRGEREVRELTRLQGVVVSLQINDAVWERAMTLGRRAAAQGLNVPSPDLLIVATAQHHGAALESIDAHIERLMKLK